MRLGTGRYSELLGRLLTQSGALDVAAELSPEVSPVLVLENDRPEWLFLSNQRALSCQLGTLAASAATTTGRLRNPTGSNVLAVVTNISGSAQAAARLSVFIGTATTDLATSQNPIALDSRYSLLGGAALKASREGVAPTGLGIEGYDVLATTRVVFQSPPIVLLPGSHMDFCVNTADVAGLFNVRWREREIGRYEQR
jgi:hypothetical protein